MLLALYVPIADAAPVGPVVCQEVNRHLHGIVEVVGATANHSLFLAIHELVLRQQL